VNRRHEIRRVRRDLTRRGCNCTPAVTIVPTATAQSVGAVSGAVVRHELGCTLGDRFLELNRAGYIPSTISHEGCDR
jgi:hypothetical protein